MANTVIVTATGDSIISGRMIGSTPTQAEPKYLGWGGGGVAGGPFTAAKTDVGPFNEFSEARYTCTSAQATTTYTDDTYQTVGTLTASTGETVVEVLLSDSSTKPYSSYWSTAPSGSGGTSGTVNSSYTPANNTYIQCRTEVLKVTNGSGGTSLTLQRGQNGSSAISLSNNDVVTCGNIPPAGTGTGTGNLFVHATFTGIALNSGDSIQSTINVAFN